MNKIRILMIFCVAFLLVLISQNTYAKLNFGGPSAVRKKIKGLKKKVDEHPRTPEIESLTGEPNYTTKSGTTTVVCIATDPNEDDLEYTWECDYGTFTGSGSEVIWTAPDNTGVYTITCTVSDYSSRQDQKTVDIYITPGTEWVRQWGSSGDEYPSCIAVGNSGDIYIGGWTDGEYDGNTNQGEDDLTLTRYTSSGTREWTVQLGTSGNDRISDIILDTSDNIFVVGRTEGDLEGNTNTGMVDIFLMKFNSNGVLQWTELYGTSGNDSGLDLSFDGSGNLYIAANCQGDLAGSGYLGGFDIILMRVSASDGAVQWIKQWGTSSDDGASNLLFDSGGYIYLTGVTEGDLDGSGNAGFSDVFLMKVDISDGSVLWLRQWGTVWKDSPAGIAFNDSGDIMVTGSTAGDLSTGGQSWWEGDIFWSGFDADGNNLWMNQLKTTTWEDAYNSIISNGQTFICGGVSETTIEISRQDGILASVDQYGELQWANSYIGTESSYDDMIAIAEGPSGELYCVGRTRGSMASAYLGEHDNYLIKMSY